MGGIELQLWEEKGGRARGREGCLGQRASALLPFLARLGKGALSEVAPVSSQVTAEGL